MVCPGPTGRACAVAARALEPRGRPARRPTAARALVRAAAVGYCGERGDELRTEQAPSGQGFLASVCRRWEAATSVASDAGIRVVHLRTGLPLHPSGGLMKRVLLPFRFGLGGR